MKNMTAFIIQIKTLISIKKMRYYISRFVKSSHFKSEYVCVYVILYTVENTEIKLTETKYIDLKNNYDLKSLYFIIIRSYLNLENKDNMNINKIVFYYQELKKNTYLNNKFM